jgi:hypothetical protein
VIWRRLDRPGHESSRLSCHDGFWTLAGTAIFPHGGDACRLDYSVTCDAAWRTLSGRVAGWIGDETIEIEARAGSDRAWRLNGADCPQVAGCVDLDLNFSPATNLLPIRRLSLPVAGRASVRAAWLRFPGFTLEPLEQFYHRVDATTYRYESAGGRFTADLKVDATGFVVRYGDLWEVETR